MYFYVSSLLGRKSASWFACSVGENFYDAQYHLEMQKCIWLSCWSQSNCNWSTRAADSLPRRERQEEREGAAATRSDSMALLGRAPAAASKPASAGALPNGCPQPAPQVKPLEIPLSGAIWWRRSHQNVAPRGYIGSSMLLASFAPNGRTQSRALEQQPAERSSYSSLPYGPRRRWPHSTSMRTAVGAQRGGRGRLGQRGADLRCARQLRELTGAECADRRTGQLSWRHLAACWRAATG